MKVLDYYSWEDNEVIPMGLISTKQAVGHIPNDSSVLLLFHTSQTSLLSIPLVIWGTF